MVCVGWFFLRSNVSRPPPDSRTGCDLRYCRHEQFLSADSRILHPAIHLPRGNITFALSKAKLNTCSLYSAPAMKTGAALRSESPKEGEQLHSCLLRRCFPHPSLSRRALKCWCSSRKWHKEIIELWELLKKCTFHYKYQKHSQNRKFPWCTPPTHFNIQRWVVVWPQLPL